jgi:transposase
MEGTTQVLDGPAVTSIPRLGKRYGNSGSSISRLIREVKRNTAKRFDAEYKIRVVLEGFRKEIPVSELCRREKISTSVYYLWLKEFMEGGKARLKGATLREATKDETDNLKEENSRLKELAGEQALELFLFKKRLLW